MDPIVFIGGMSPVAWQHVNMFDSFEFGDENPNIDLQGDDCCNRYHLVLH
jgi:hypothetical protein